MRLSDLDPRITSTHLSFDCPKCRAPRRISIEITRGDPGSGRWKISGHDASYRPFYERLTLEPSIISTNHGREKTLVDGVWSHSGKVRECGGHWRIINGIVVDA